MTYDARESSTATGEPFECIQFTIYGEEFRYTTAPEAVTVGGNLYVPGQWTRTAAEISAEVGTVQTIDVTVSITSEVGALLRKRNAPESVAILIIRAHYGDDLSTQFNVEWRGEAVAYSIARGTVTMKTQSVIQARMNRIAAARTYRFTCNNNLFDTRCKVLEADHKTSSTVTQTLGTVVTVAATGFPTDELSGGVLVCARNGGRAVIISNTATTVTLMRSMPDLRIGDSVDFIRGCDKRFDTCISVFTNVENFSGFPYMPNTNPFGQ